MDSIKFYLYIGNHKYNNNKPMYIQLKKYNVYSQHTYTN